MTGGKDEKIMDPLFPRLHINDTEIGGPRAPPRNKMAVYEQLSIPSQKCSTGQVPSLPLPPNNGSIFVPSVSSNQGGRNESTVFPSFDIPLTTPAHSSDKLHPLSYDALYMHTTLTDLEQKFMEANYPSLYESMHLSWDTEYGSLQPHDFSNSKNASGPKLGDEDDFMVPAFIHSKITQSSSMHPHSIDKESEIKSSPSQPGCSTVILGNSMPKTATNTFSSSMQRNSRDKQLKRTNTTDLTSRQHGRNHGEENLKNSSTNKEMEKLASNSSPKENASEPLKHTNASLNQDRQSSPVENIEGGVQNIDSRLHLEYKAGFPPKNIADSNGISVDMEKRNVSRGDRESCSRSSLWNGQKSPIEAENGGNYCDEKAHKSLQVGNVDRNDDSSETSMVDSTSGLEISPDDVVGAIGQKHFWKARRAMANQQRLFAVQVFELHRLIKVQRLIAGSPNLLLQDPYLSKPSLKVSPPKMLPSEKVLKYPPQIKAKDESQRPKQGPESAVGTASGDLNKQRVTQNSSYGPYSGSLPPLPVATKNKTVPPWYFHPPPGNQWLLPIMSPTEGLVYKPFSGAFPPTAGFMPPIYGDWGPMTVPSMAGGCLNPAFGIPGLAPVAQVYLPVMNVVNFASPFEGGSSYAGTWPDKQAEKLSTEKINHNMRVNPSHVLRRPGNTKLNYKRRQ